MTTTKKFQDKHFTQMMNRIKKEYPGYQFSGIFQEKEDGRVIKITDYSYGGSMMVEYFINQSTGRLGS